VVANRLSSRPSCGPRLISAITVALPALCFVLAGWGALSLFTAPQPGAHAEVNEDGRWRGAEEASSHSAGPCQPLPAVAGKTDGGLEPLTTPDAAASEIAVPTSAAEEPAAADDPSALNGPDFLPAEVLLTWVPQGRQARNLSCEFQSAADLAWYYGVPYTWEEIFARVGHDPGGNPHKGFVGVSLDDAPGYVYPRGYGVYAEPIAEALQSLGLDAQAHYGQSVEWLKGQVARGRPVMIWAVGGMAVRPTEEWVAQDGTTVRGVGGEHTFLVVGYDSGGVWVVDPWVGERRYFGWEPFVESWDILERMSVVVAQDKPITPGPLRVEAN